MVKGLIQMKWLPRKQTQNCDLTNSQLNYGLQEGETMSDDHYQESVDTEEMEDLVTEILRRFRRPYPQDITDQVFLAIEHDINKKRQYEIFAHDDIPTANAWVGRLVKEHTGLKVKGTCTTPKSQLIKSYSILG